MKVAFYLLALVLTASVARAAKFSVDLAAAHSEKACRTAKYRDDTGKPVSNMLLVRQGCKFDVVVELDAPASTAPVITATRTGGGATTGWKSAPAAGAAPGGKVWKLTVTAGSAAGGDTVVGEHSLVATAGAEKVPLALKAWLLFNPFDKTSPFFVTNDARRADMTENEQGAIWVGSSSKPTWSPWAYNQFSANVWDVVFKTTSKISSSDLANHVTAVRAFAKQIATVILEGKWGSTGYEDSDKKPWEWASSEDIYAVVRQKNRKAKYGQCMIYSAVTASYLRAMGVPAASNTGYDFVQDSGGDRLIKVAYKLDASGQYQWSEADNNKFGDKVWNFHAWTIVDMARPDLGIAEVKPNIADGTWHAGPVSLDKFKAGDMKANYDTSSYDTCINSDVQYVFLDQTGKVQSTWEKPFIPANSIVTKKDDSPVGCKNTYDASTGRYNGLCLVETVGDYKKTIPKPNARPASMRFRSLRSRVAGGPGADTDADDDDKEHHVAEQEHDADEGYVISTSMPLSRRLGNKFHAAMKLNKPAEELQVTVWATTYDGRPIYVLMEGKVKNEKQYRINVPTEAWFRGKNGAHDVAEQAKTAAATHIKAVFTALNKGKVVAADVRVMPISMPKVNILCGKKTVHVGDKITCSISFSNPMPYKIKATLDIDLAGNTKLPGDFEPQTIEIGEKVNRADASSYLGRWVSVHLPTPTTPGKTLLIVSVRVPTLNEIKGVSEFEVLERPATELEKVQLRKVAPAGQGRAPQTPIAPPQAPNAKLPPPK